MKKRKSKQYSSRIDVSAVAEAMVFTSDQPRNWRPQGQGLVRIHAGCYLRPSAFRLCRTKWDQRRLVDIARLIALSHKKPTCVPTGASAGLIHCLDVQQDGNRIHLRTLGRRCTTKLKLGAVWFANRQVAPAATVIVHHRPSVTARPVLVHGIRCDDLATATAVASLIHRPPLAHLFACAVLHVVSDFDKWIPAASRIRALEGREFLQAWLLRLPKYARDKRRAQRVVGWADPGCESPGEAHLLRILKSAGLTQVETQIRIVLNHDGDSFFVDCGFPQIKLAIEFDGWGKFGDTIEEYRAAEERLTRRQRRLEALGWTVIRVRWSDLDDEAGIVAQVRHYLALLGAAGGALRNGPRSEAA